MFPDHFTVEHHGSVFLVRPVGPDAVAYLREHADVVENPEWFNDALVVPPRFIGGLLSSLREAGWEVRK